MNRDKERMNQLKMLFQNCGNGLISAVDDICSKWDLNKAANAVIQLIITDNKVIMNTNQHSF